MSSIYSVGVPSKLLKEFKDRRITVEVSSGEVYKGIVHETEENLSVSLGDVKATLVSGRVVKMDEVYIKGSRIRLINLPDSAADYMTKLMRPPSRGRGGFRGGRGKGRSGGSGARPRYGR